MLTCTLVVTYVLAIAFYWHERYTTLFQIMSVPVWSSILFLTSSLMGSYRPLFLFTFGLLVLIGVYSFVYEYFNSIRRKLMRSSADNTATVVHSSDEDSAAVENVGSLYDEPSDAKVSISLLNMLYSRLSLDLNNGLY